MRPLIIITALLLTMLGHSNNTTAQHSLINKTIKMENNTEKKAIEQLLFTYRDALNASSVADVLPLYAENGIFMPTNAPTATGQEQLAASYAFVFKTIQLHIEFYIEEIGINGDLAFARTSSKGTTLIHAIGQTVPEENRELFVFVKEHGSWKIASYMFNKTK